MVFIIGREFSQVWRAFANLFSWRSKYVSKSSLNFLFHAPKLIFCCLLRILTTSLCTLCNKPHRCSLQSWIVESNLQQPTVDSITVFIYSFSLCGFVILASRILRRFVQQMVHRKNYTLDERKKQESVTGYCSAEEDTVLDWKSAFGCNFFVRVSSNQPRITPRTIAKRMKCLMLKYVITATAWILSLRNSYFQDCVVEKQCS